MSFANRDFAKHHPRPPALPAACRGLAANDANIDACLSALVKNCADTAHSMTQCAAHADSMALQLLMTRRAATWRRWAGELGALLSESGATGGMPTARADDADLTEMSDAALLAACERRESDALKVCREALDEDIPRILRAVLLRHVEGIHNGRAQMRSAGTVAPLAHA